LYVIGGQTSLLGDKMSPVDKGLEVFKELVRKRIKV
jgi:hypothetical protein